MAQRLNTKLLAFYLSLLLLAGGIGWSIGHEFPSNKIPLAMTYQMELDADAFMRKYQTSAAYLTILKLDHTRNTRTPIYRAFNRKDVKEAVTTRLNGGDGALPMFIKDDNSNNNQLITIMQGELTCDPFSAGGLSRVWPDLIKRFTISCRVPIPPVPGQVRGYIVVHLDETPRPYEMETIKRDLQDLAKKMSPSR